MTKKQRRVAAVPAADTAARRRTGWLGLVALLVGLGLLGGSLTHRWYVSSEAERLRAEGVPVSATVVDRAGGGGRGSGIDRLEVSYLHDGAQYYEWIPCAGLTGCRSTPPGELTLWVDPTDPAHFVAQNGHTDGSLSFLNSWTLIPVGALAVVIGAGLLILVAREHKNRT
ncbi:DUF3592 domain-containing protein [Micromonospora echinaurantiaca]|uniref:DUF3592 domain-containing protein n=1 Tax=Micromonospora echinaurantiaca TaxID=47857 RepID=UPI00342817E4